MNDYNQKADGAEPALRGWMAGVSWEVIIIRQIETPSFLENLTVSPSVPQTDFEIC